MFCLLPRHAAIDEVGDLFLEVLVDRLGKLVITTAPGEQLSEPAHQASWRPAS